MLGDGKAEVVLNDVEVLVTIEVIMMGVVLVMIVVLADDEGLGREREDDEAVD